VQKSRAAAEAKSAVKQSVRDPAPVDAAAFAQRLSAF
jgi:hypothetical protein